MRLFGLALLSLATIQSVTTIQTAAAQAFSKCAQPGEGAALLEGECVTVLGSYQRRNFNRTTNAFFNDIDQYNFSIAGQKAVADKVYVSLNAGYSRSDSPLSPVGLEQEVESFSLGAAVKYVEKDLLLSASISASRDDVDQTTAAGFANTPGAGVVFSNDQTDYNAVLALRAATLFDDGNGYYAKPSLDVGLIYTHTKNSNVIFQSLFPGDIETSDHVFAFIRPALEIGLDVEYSAYSIRPFVFGGAQFLFNEDETRKIDGTASGIAFTDDEIRFERNSSLAFLGAGATVFASGGFSSRVTYSATFQSRQVAHNVGVKLQLDF